MNEQQRLPLFYNPESGTSSESLHAILDDNRIAAQPVAPQNMAEEIQRSVEKGAKRILVSGGDGTIALAAAEVAGTTTVLGVIPSGTLNHFAQRVGIPTETRDALEVALTGKARGVDVGYVNDTLFINTSSVGAYPLFVKNREKLESRMSYFTASLVAGFRRMLRFRKVRVTLLGNELHTPLVFVGVAERQLQVPYLGQVKKDGQRKLHLIAVDSMNKIEIVQLLLRVFLFGADPLQKQMALQNELVDEVSLRFRKKKRRIHVAVDGELIWLHGPLQYRFAQDELRVALP